MRDGERVGEGVPQWSPGLMAGGRLSSAEPSASSSTPPQWSPGLMAGGSTGTDTTTGSSVDSPQWSPGLMAGGRAPTRGGCATRSASRNGAPA